MLTFNFMELNNYKSYKGRHEFQLSRPPGLYYILGDNQEEPDLGSNGAGKTGLFDALYWCITGKTIRSSRPAASIETRGTKGICSVSLDLDIDDSNVVITRSRRPNGLTISIDGEASITVTQDDVDKIICISDEAFRRSILIGQFGKMFLDLGPTEQSEMFGDILPLEVWVKAAKAASAKAISFGNVAIDWKSKYDRANGQYSELVQLLKQQRVDSQVFETQRNNDLAEIENDLKTETQLIVDLLAKSAALPPIPDKLPKADFSPKEASLASLGRVVAGARSSLAPEPPEVGRLTAELARLATDLEKFRAAKKKSVCPECGQTVHAKHLDDKIQVLQDRWTVVNNLLDEKRKLVIDLEAKLTTAIENQQKAQLDLDTLKAKAEEARSKADATWQELVTKHQNIEFEIKQADNNLTSLAGMKRKTTEEVNPFSSTIIKSEARLLVLKAEYETALKKQEEYDAKEQQAKFWVNAFKEIRLSLIDETILELEVATNRHAESLGLHGWEIRFATERENTAGKTTVGFTTYVYPPGSEDPEPWDSYSGGEGQRWQLSAMFGLSEVLLGRAGLMPNIEILDEPTRHLGESGIDALLTHLSERARELNRVIYLVDHHSLGIGSFDGIIKIVKDENGSRIIEG